MKSQITVTTPYGAETKTVTNENQRFACGQRVYIRPIYESSMNHFDCDLITNVKYTYAQAFGNCEPCSQYSTNVASWYDEGQLMPVSDDCTIEQARAICEGYFGESYKLLKEKRQEAINSDPMIQSIRESLSNVFIEAILGDRK